MRAVPVMGLVIEATLNSVSASTGRGSSTLVTPVVAVSSSLPEMIATAIPGTLNRAAASVMTLLSVPRSPRGAEILALTAIAAS